MLKRISLLELCQFGGRIKFEELFDAFLSAAHFDKDVVSLDVDTDAQGAELVDSGSLPQKHEFHLISVG